MLYLYVETDKDHIALRYKEKEGDIKRFKGHANNGQILKDIDQQYIGTVSAAFSIAKKA